MNYPGFLPTFLLLACCATLRAAETTAPLYQETYRPQFHYSPPRNWTNDPNGLIYVDGEYHLFFQYNPFGDKWGHMSWGHAVASDLFHWKTLPVAIPELETSGTMIFSGSCVLDADNTSGLGLPGKPAMVAVYTAHRNGNQSQALAYSTDRGRTWKQYEKNPVLDVGKQDFRDPKVFMHKESGLWIMAVTLSVEKKISFYSSSDLKKWKHLSDFGPAGDSGGIWECPDLFELPVENGAGTKKWVLLHSVERTMQYFIGTFDGTMFRNDNPPDLVLRPDYGPDYFAAVTFNDAPSDAGRVAVGWMNNWRYAGDQPTSPWRGQMSLPRRLSLRKTNDGIRLVQEPVRTVEKLRNAHFRMSDQLVGSSLTIPLQSNQAEIRAVFMPESSREFGLKVAAGTRCETVISYDGVNERMVLDRTRSGVAVLSKDFASSHTAPCRLVDGKLDLRVFVDSSSVEVFANGQAVMTALIFPDPPDAGGVEIFTRGEPVRVQSLDAWKLKSVW